MDGSILLAIRSLRIDSATQKTSSDYGSKALRAVGPRTERIAFIERGPSRSGIKVDGAGVAERPPPISET